MGTDIDRLEVQVQAQAQKANAELDKLVNRLDKVSNSLGKVNGSGLQGLANGVNRLSNAMQGMSSIKTTDFSRLARNIEKLGNIDQAKINGTASALRTISSALNATSGLSSGAMQVAELASSISKLGYKSASNAITNIPLMATALQDLMKTLSTTPNVSKNLIDMTNALSNLASQGSKVRSASNGINNSLKKYSNSAKHATASTKTLSLSIAGLYARFWALRRAVQFTWGSIEKSMDYLETINLFETSFKKIGMETAQEMGMDWGSESANEFSKAFIEQAHDFNKKITNALSLDPDMFMNYQAIFAQMSNSMGLVSESAMNISESFTLLGADIASLWNLDFDVSMKKLQSGLAGQIRPLRELGIDISKTSLQMTALNYGITDSLEKMSSAAKVQLRWLAIMDQAEVSFGDIASTINAPANQLRVLQQQWVNLSRSIGNVFMPIVAKVLPYINALVIALRRLIDAFAKLVGFELPDYSDSSIYKDAASDIEGVYDEIEDGANNATKANEKLRKSLRKFDELNILSSNKNKSSDKGGTGLGGGSGYGILDEAIAKKTASYMEKFNRELSKMSNFAENLADEIESFFVSVAKKAEPTTRAFKKLWNEGLSDLAGFMINNLSNLYHNLLVPIGSWALGEGIPNLVNALNDLLKGINWTRLLDSINNLNKALAPFAVSVGRGFVNFVTELVRILTPAVSALVSALATALDGLAWVIKQIPPQVAEALGGAIGGMVTAILTFKAAESVIKIIKGIKDALEIFAITIMVHPWVATAAGIAAVAGAIISLNKSKFDSSDVGKYVKELDKLIESSKDLNKETQTLLDNHDERRRDVEAEYGAISILADEYFKLADKQELTNDEQALLVAYAKELIDKIPELSDLIDDQTGAYKGTKKQIEGLITKTKEYYLVQAAQESLVEIAKKQYEQERKLADLKDSRNRTEKLLIEKQKEYKVAVKEYSDAVAEAGTSGYTSAGHMNALSREVGELRKSLEETERQIGETEGSQSSLNDEWRYATDYIKKYSDTTEAEMSKVKTNTKNALDETSRTVRDYELPKKKIDVSSNASNAVTDMDKKIRAFVPPKKSISIASNISAVASDVEKRVNNIKLPKKMINLGWKVDSAPNFKIRSSSQNISIEKYAQGGFPNTGEMFVARESGPEMVGKIGNRTAVANNEQITTGIAIAVEGAVARAMSSVMPVRNNTGGGLERLVVNVLGETVVDRAISGVNRQSIIDGVTTINV